MNSIHEPGPNGDSKISSSRKTVQKAKPDAQAPSKPSRHAQVRTSAPRRAHGCRIVVVSPTVSCQGAGRVAGQRGRIAATVPLTPCASTRSPAPSTSACSPSTLAELSLPRAQRRIVAAQPAESQGPAPCRSAPLAISWAGTRARPAPSLSSSTIQHFCIAAPKTSLTKPPQSRYKFCIVTLPVHPTYCNTIFPAFPAFSCNTSSCIAIQFSSSQAAQATIQMLCCNTIFQHSLLLLAIQFQYCNTNFFFFTI